MSSSKGQQQHVPLYSLPGSSLVFHNFRQHEKKRGTASAEIDVDSNTKWSERERDR